MVAPSCPCRPPVLLSDGSRRLFLLFLTISCDGGTELVRLLRPFVKSRSCYCKDTICRCNFWTCSCNALLCCCNSSTCIFSALYSANGVVIVSMNSFLHRKVFYPLQNESNKTFHNTLLKSIMFVYLLLSG